MGLKILLIGSDPEVFLVDGEGNLKSAIGIIPGSKDSPHLISDNGEAIQVDNVLAEFNVAPSETPEQLYSSIRFCLDHIERISGLKTEIMSSVKFPKEELSKDSRSFIFGCEPDYDGYNVGMPRTSKRTLTRTAGGHISVSFKDWDVSNVDVMRLARCFDEIVTKQLIHEGIENDVLRRQMYGRPGSFRVKDWGFEYRTLSNQWIKSLDSVRNTWDLVYQAVEYFNAGGDVKEGTFELISGINVEQKQLQEA